MKKSILKNTIKIITSLLLVIIFVYLVLRNIDLNKVKYSLAYANWFEVALSFIFGLLSMPIRAWRWKYLLHSYERVTFRNLLEATSVSRFLANVLPFRAADLVQAVHLGETEKISKTAVMASVAAERVVDLIYLFIGFVAVSFFVFFPTYLKNLVACSLLLIIGIFLIFVYKIEWLAVFFAPRSKYISEKLAIIKIGLRVFKSPALFAKASLLTILNWAASFASALLLFHAFTSSYPVIVVIAYLIVPAIITIIPFTPGSIGVWDFFAVATLTSFHIDKSLALGITAIMHLMALAVPTLFALMFSLKGLNGRKKSSLKNGEKRS